MPLQGSVELDGDDEEETDPPMMTVKIKNKFKLWEIAIIIFVTRIDLNDKSTSCNNKNHVMKLKPYELVGDLVELLNLSQLLNRNK